MPAPFTIEDETTGKALWSCDASGNVIQLGDLRVNGNTTVVGTQTFTGNTTVSGNLAVTGNETVTGTMAVTGASTLTGAVGLSTTVTNTLTADVAGYAATNSQTNANPIFHGQSAASTGALLGSAVAGDAHDRFQANVAGLVQWGNGTATVDTSLSRTGVGTLTATGLAVTNALSVGTTLTGAGIASFNAGTNSSGSAPVLTPSFASGTAAQLADLTRDYMVYLTIGTAGTANTLAIGPTSSPANTLISSATATTGEMMVVRLPAGWFLKWTATTATLATQTAIGC
jgi:hypothetical protein